MNHTLAIAVIEKLLHLGVREFIVCPGGRNAPFTNLLSKSGLEQVLCYEERSAAFYALGRARASNRPVAVITTSGTASGELLPAMMEAYYTATPLIAVTADRPRRYRGSGAPQSAEQESLFGVYARTTLDLAAGDTIDCSMWDQRSPLHLNVCFEEPARDEQSYAFSIPQFTIELKSLPGDKKKLDHFLKNVTAPLVIVSTLKPKDREAVVAFLQALNAPVYLEGISGIRRDPRLAHLEIYEPNLKLHDGILRIGGVPTHRVWRDLEDLQERVEMLSINDAPFSGLSWAGIVHTDIAPYLESYGRPASDWKIAPEYYEAQRDYQQAISDLMDEEPLAEASLVRSISQALPKPAQLYLGQSLPIRQWDLSADYEPALVDVTASRGVNGIDGQISTFFGQARPDCFNCALIGDLTALYDFAGPWVLKDRPDLNFAIVVINNGGGKLFKRLFTNPDIQNLHTHSFEPFARFWNLPYAKWHEVPDNANFSGMIELIPDLAASDRFWKKLDALKSSFKEQAMAIR